MATTAQSDVASRARARGIRVAGFAIIGLGAGAALMPAGKSLSSNVIGALLVAAGLIEIVAGSLRRDVRAYAMAAGGITTLAGLLFVLNPETHFFPMVTPIVAWLLIRSLILAYAATHVRGSVRTWMALSGGMDFVLAALLIAGLSITSVVVSVFGPTPQLIASFAWVLAASFVVNGLLLLEVASCVRADEPQH
jgi:predicted cation transporter